MERGDFCKCLAQKGDIEKKGGFFQKAKVLPLILNWESSEKLALARGAKPRD
jgi:hypothetical protein